eukprot:768821-Hanusia_phi.AAC.6
MGDREAGKGNAWLYMASACSTRFIVLVMEKSLASWSGDVEMLQIEEDFSLVEEFERASVSHAHILSHCFPPFTSLNLFQPPFIFALICAHRLLCVHADELRSSCQSRQTPTSQDVNTELRFLPQTRTNRPGEPLGPEARRAGAHLSGEVDQTHLLHYLHFSNDVDVRFPKSIQRFMFRIALQRALKYGTSNSTAATSNTPR